RPVFDVVAEGLGSISDLVATYHHIAVLVAAEATPALLETLGRLQHELDEPTNHLDIEAIEWLETFLAEYAGAVVFVTHDRAFLQRLATRIVEIDRGTLTSWPGDYATYLRRKEDSLADEAVQQEKFEKKLAEEEVWLRQGIKARRTRNEGRVKALEAMRAERAARRGQMGNVRLQVEQAEQSAKLVFEMKHVSKAFGEVR